MLAHAVAGVLAFIERATGAAGVRFSPSPPGVKEGEIEVQRTKAC